MNTCPNCNISFEGKFCPNCGTPGIEVGAAPASQQTTYPEQNPVLNQQNDFNNNQPQPAFHPQGDAAQSGYVSNEPNQNAAAAEAQSPLHCPNCGIVFEGRFCPRCGSTGIAANPQPAAAPVQPNEFSGGVTPPVQAPPQPTRCPRCGVEVMGTFCPNCGLNMAASAAPQAPIQYPNPSAQPKKKKLSGGIIALICVICAVGVLAIAGGIFAIVYIFSANNSDSDYSSNYDSSYDYDYDYDYDNSWDYDYDNSWDYSYDDSWDYSYDDSWGNDDSYLPTSDYLDWTASDWFAASDSEKREAIMEVMRFMMEENGITLPDSMLESSLEPQMDSLMDSIESIFEVSDTMTLREVAEMSTSVMGVMLN